MSSFFLSRLTAAFALICCATRADAAPIVWSTASGGNGHSYEAISTQPNTISWSQANADAQALGGYLATITSSAENNFVYSLIDSSPYWYVLDPDHSYGPWIGGFQSPPVSDPTVNWTWVTGEPFSYSSWATGEPNHYEGFAEDYIQYFATDGPLMAPTWNDDTDAPSGINFPESYVVEFNPSPVPEPASLVLFAIGGFGLSGAAIVRRRRLLRR